MISKHKHPVQNRLTGYLLLLSPLALASSRLFPLPLTHYHNLKTRISAVPVQSGVRAVALASVIVVNVFADGVHKEKLLKNQYFKIGYFKA